MYTDVALIQAVLSSLTGGFVAEAAEAPLIVGSVAMIKDSMSRMEKCFLIDKTNI